MTLTLKIATQFVQATMRLTMRHHHKASYQVWLQKVQWFRQYLLDKAQTLTEGQMDIVIPAYPPPPFPPTYLFLRWDVGRGRKGGVGREGGGGGGRNKKSQVQKFKF